MTPTIAFICLSNKETYVTWQQKSELFLQFSENTKVMFFFAAGYKSNFLFKILVLKWSIILLKIPFFDTFKIIWHMQLSNAIKSVQQEKDSFKRALDIYVYSKWNN